SDLSDPLLQQLLEGSVDLVRRRLFETANSGRRASIARAMVAISGDAPVAPSQRDFGSAQSEVVALHRSGGLNREALLQFARERKYEQTIAVLSSISGLPITAADKLVTGERQDSDRKSTRLNSSHSQISYAV